MKTPFKVPLRGILGLLSFGSLLSMTESHVDLTRPLDAPAHHWGYFHERFSVRQSMLSCCSTAARSANVNLDVGYCADHTWLANPGFCRGTANPNDSVAPYLGQRAFACGALFAAVNTLPGLGKSLVLFDHSSRAPRRHLSEVAS